MTLFIWWKKRKTRRVAVGPNKSEGNATKVKENSTEKEEETKAVKYPIITIIQKTKSSTSDEHSIASSNISSLYDTQSQLHDQSWFEETKQIQEMMEEVKRIREVESGLIPSYRSEEALFDASDSANETCNNKSSQNSISMILPSPKKSTTASNIVSNVELEQSDSRDDDTLDPRRTVISI